MRQKYGTRKRNGARMTDETTEIANRKEGSPQLKEMERVTLTVSLIGVKMKSSNGMMTAGIRSQNSSFKIGFKSILLVPSWTSHELPSWYLRNRKKMIRFSKGGNKYLKSINRSMLMRKINLAIVGPWVLIFFFLSYSLLLKKLRCRELWGCCSLKRIYIALGMLQLRKYLEGYLFKMQRVQRLVKWWEDGRPGWYHILGRWTSRMVPRIVFQMNTRLWENYYFGKMDGTTLCFSNEPYLLRLLWFFFQLSIWIFVRD